MKSKFMLIFEEIMNNMVELKESSIVFKFDRNSQGKIVGNFSDVDENGEVTEFVVTENDEGDFSFTIESAEEDKEFLDEKQFIAAYPTIYEFFKKAVNEFKESRNIATKEEEDATIVTPDVNQFSDVIGPDGEKGTSIETKSGIFKFKSVKDSEYTGLATAEFILFNEDPSEDELPKYDVVATIKMANKNSAITQFKLKDPDENLEVALYTNSEFKNKYPEIYNDLRNALSKFEKEIAQK